MEIINSNITDKFYLTHNIRVVKSKLFNSTNKYVIVLDNEIICLTSSIKRVHKILAYIQGYDTKISDDKIKKEIDRILKNIVRYKNDSIKRIDKS